MALDPESRKDATRVAVLLAVLEGLATTSPAVVGAAINEWSSSGPVGAGRLAAVVVDPHAPTTVYAAEAALQGNAAGGVFKSGDGGATWSNAGSITVAVRALAIDPLQPQTLYAGTDAAVLKSTDGATT